MSKSSGSSTIQRFSATLAARAAAAALAGGLALAGPQGLGIAGADNPSVDSGSSSSAAAPSTQDGGSEASTGPGVAARDQRTSSAATAGSRAETTDDGGPATTRDPRAATTPGSSAAETDDDPAPSAANTDDDPTAANTDDLGTPTTASTRVAARSALPQREPDVTRRSARRPDAPTVIPTRDAITVNPSIASTPPSPQVTVGAADNATPHAAAAALPWTPWSILAILVSDGTAANPNAGFLFGNGFSFDATTCPAITQCDGGRGGLLQGNGGNGWNGGIGGTAGLIGNGGNGGNGVAVVRSGNGGHGGSAVLFGTGGRGGDAFRFSAGARGGDGGSGGFFTGNGGNGGQAATGARGGDGGKGGLFGGVGGRGGTGGPGAVQCADGICTVSIFGGVGGSGGAGGLLFGTDGANGVAPLPLDSSQFVGYHRVQDANVGSNGQGLLFPDENDPTKPYAIPGTVVPNVQLPAGTVVARFGYPGGAYLAPDGTYFAQLGLPPSSAVQPYFEYVVADPTKMPAGYSIEQSQVAPWFGQPGGGIQFRILGPDGKSAPAQALLDSGYLAPK